MKTLLGDL